MIKITTTEFSRMMGPDEEKVTPIGYLLMKDGARVPFYRTIKSAPIACISMDDFRSICEDVDRAWRERPGGCGY